MPVADYRTVWVAESIEHPGSYINSTERDETKVPVGLKRTTRIIGHAIQFDTAEECAEYIGENSLYDCRPTEHIIYKR